MSTSTRPPVIAVDGRMAAPGTQTAGAAPGGASHETQQRQLTVMFADLVGSTSLLEEHGAEAFGDFLRLYHSICTEATRAQDGTVANYLGDGVISYFGYPRGGEDEPLRAVQAAWSILNSLRAMGGEDGMPLSARIGIATGRVVIHQKEGDHYGENVIGACLNKAARLQTIADENTAVVCGTTRRLVGKAFEFDELGPQELKGFQKPEPAYGLRSRRRRGLSRFEALRGGRRSPLVGREETLDLLRRRLADAAKGSGSVAVLAGEPGIGKSRLIAALREDPSAEASRFLPLQCSPVHQFSSLHPVKEYLDWVSGVQVDDPPGARRDKLRRLFQTAWGTPDEQTAVLMDVVASSGPEQEANADLGVLLKRRMAFQILAEKLFSTALPGRPLCVLFEDVHWIDPTSAEFLEMLARRAPEHPAAVLVTTRPEGPFADRLEALGEVIALERLSEAQAVELARAVGRQAGLSDELLDVIIEKSDGIPLFVEEYAQLLADSPEFQRAGGNAAALRGIPLTLNGLVQAKVDRLDPHAQRIARIGSVWGRTFEIDRVCSLSELDAKACASAIAALQAADLAYEDTGKSGEAQVTFKHALVQDAIYGSLASPERRRLHSAIADALLAQGEAQRVSAEVVADHLLGAGRHQESASWRFTAALSATGEGSAAEALAHVRLGLKAIEAMPDGDGRDRLELQLRAIEGPTLMVTQGPGSPNFGAAQARGLELLRKLDHRESLVPVIYNTALHDWACGRLAQADDRTDEIFAILRAEPSDGAFLAAHTMRGLVAWHRGDNETARTHLTQTVERYDPALHRDFYNRFLKEFGVFGHFYLGLTHTVMGDAAAGVDHARRALELAEIVRRPHAYGFGLLANFVTAMMRGDVETAADHSGRSLAYAQEQGFPEFAAMSLVCQGWCRTQRSELEPGIAQMEEGARLWAMTGFQNWQALFATYLAEAYVAAGRLDEARDLLDLHDGRVAELGESQFEPPLALARAALFQASGDREGAIRAASAASEKAARNHAALWMRR